MRCCKNLQPQKKHLFFALDSLRDCNLFKCVLICVYIFYFNLFFSIVIGYLKVEGNLCCMIIQGWVVFCDLSLALFLTAPQRSQSRLIQKLPSYCEFYRLRLSFSFKKSLNLFAKLFLLIEFPFAS